MAIRYKALTELYQETQRSVTAPDQWRAFSFAGSNYMDSVKGYKGAAPHGTL